MAAHADNQGAHTTPLRDKRRPSLPLFVGRARNVESNVTARLENVAWRTVVVAQKVVSGSHVSVVALIKSNL